MMPTVIVLMLFVTGENDLPRSEEGNFNSDSVDEFTIEESDIGDLQKIR